MRKLRKLSYSLAYCYDLVSQETNYVDKLKFRGLSQCKCAPHARINARTFSREIFIHIGHFKQNFPDLKQLGLPAWKVTTVRYKRGILQRLNQSAGKSRSGGVTMVMAVYYFTTCVIKGFMFET